MSFSKPKKNRNEEDSSDEEYMVSEFSYVSTSSSNDGKATVSSGGAQRMRESFCMHFNAVACFWVLNENVTAAGTTRNAESGATAAKRLKRQQ